jgi:hypothetical protein
MPPLVQALRQCDGEHVQCLVLVRDDFWMATTQFFRQLEVPLLEGSNSAAVDLFDLRHAQRVLIALGRAYGALPEAELSPEQKRFLDQVVEGLAQDSKIILVRLSLFAEMVKAKPWEPATLYEVGGTRGIGVRFLEETFSAASAPASHRLRQNAARAVLRALLPAQGTDIKGHSRSYRELCAVSGYENQPREFDALLHILDTELRLVTPAEGEPGALATGERSPVANAPGSPAGRYYQLTHDYLVAAVREWLTRKQRETRRGRAELRLAEITAWWTARPQLRYLPSCWEWATMALFTHRREWTGRQRQMMRAAGRLHGLRALVFGTLLALLLGAGWFVHSQQRQEAREAHAQALIGHLIDADVRKVPALIAELKPYRALVDPQLHQRLQRPDGSQRVKLNLSLALLPDDPAQVDYLVSRLLGATPNELLVVRAALRPNQTAQTAQLWAVALDTQAAAARRFRAACALAGLSPEDSRWRELAPVAVTGLLTEKNPSFLAGWLEALRPVRGWLLPPLATAFRHPVEQSAGIDVEQLADAVHQRRLAAALVAAYAADQTALLVDLALDADVKQWETLWPRLEASADAIVPTLRAELDRQPSPDAAESAQDTLAKRQARAAVALLRLGQAEYVWPLLRHSTDPRRRTYLVHLLGPLGTDPNFLIRHYKEELDVSARRALLLALGEFIPWEPATSLDRAPPAWAAPWLPDLLHQYQADPDAGLPGALAWLLGRWGCAAELARIDRELANGRIESTRH